MRVPSYADTYQVLLLQAADEGRGPVLFGNSFERARTAVLPFLVGERFPSVYLEYPLAGDPFLDVTMLYSRLEPGTRVDSDMAVGTEAMFDWFIEAHDLHTDTCCGFEIDTKNPELPAAAVHFQPRSHTDMVAPFCEAIGEPQRAKLYLDLASRMPKTWQLSFFGMFRGRPGSPLRVCGYLGSDEIAACAANPRHIAGRFDDIGFTAYDDAMIDQVAQLMAAVPNSGDFQFDIYPDGSLGSVFAIDVEFGVEQPHAIRASFADGPCGRIMRLLESWGAADERWKLAADSAFACALPVELDDGTAGQYAFTLMPRWVKARWANGILQPAKLYHLAQAGLLGVEHETGHSD
ncbi:MAG: hypothetical protein J5804_03100 [Eggerthellaceae bacterium]|nr:hypothetical protein [Eggerthellaceae bacterium]